MTIQHPSTGRPSGRAAIAPVRLTRRGRVVLVVLLALLAVTAFSLGRASSDAAGDAAPATRRTVVVQPGETLWQIARRAAPAVDPRETIDRIVDLNGLSTATLQPGQQLVIPG